MALVAYCSSSDDDSNHSEDDDSKPVVLIPPTGGSTSLFSSLPAPKQAVIEPESEDLTVGPRPKQTVKITIPSMKEFENDEPKPKKLKPALKGSCLIDMLPTPHNVSLKEAGRRLTPRAVAPKKIPPKNKITPKGIESKVSDDEEEITDFFSLSNLDIPPTVSAITPALVLPTPTFEHTPQEPPTVEQPTIRMETNENLTNYPIEEDIGAPCSSNKEEMLKDNRFFRLQGKNARAKEEINFIEINACDQMPKPEEWLKTVSMESTRPNHKKGTAPSSQSKRKHQITYLAYQAKEREVELKNQWAMNRLTRQQTQAKYGF